MTAGPSLSPALGGLRRPTALGVSRAGPRRGNAGSRAKRSQCSRLVPGAWMTRVVSVIRGLGGGPGGGPGGGLGGEGGGPGWLELMETPPPGGPNLQSPPARLQGNTPGQAVTAVSRGTQCRLHWNGAWRAPEEGGDPAGGNRNHPGTTPKVRSRGPCSLGLTPPASNSDGGQECLRVPALQGKRRGSNPDSTTPRFLTCTAGDPLCGAAWLSLSHHGQLLLHNKQDVRAQGTGPVACPSGLM